MIPLRMIPRRAFFVWVGDEPLPWLRQLSIESFRKFNPDWRVELLRIPPRAALLPAQNTDLFRYDELANHGGVYFDTDVVFFEPFPDDLLDADVAVTMDRSPTIGRCPRLSNHDVANRPGFTNLAVLGSTPSNGFFRHVYIEALRRGEWLSEDNVNTLTDDWYQLYGVALLDRTFWNKSKRDIEEQFHIKIANVPLDLVLPVRWFDVIKVYNDTAFVPPPGCIGVHWYGGSPEALRYATDYRSPTDMPSGTYLSRAIEVALA